MNHTRPILFILLASVHSFAATFYISPDGDDTHDGSSPSLAWRTFGQLNSAPLAPGDTVLLERGGVWRETLVPPIDDLTFGAYGDGSNPTVSGAAGIHRFDSRDGVTHRATLDRQPVQLHIDGVRAEKIASGTPPGPLQWYWEPTAGELVIGGAAPLTSRVEATVRDIGIDLNGRSGITLHDLRVVYAGLSGIRADSADRFTIKDCEIVGCYINGIRAGERYLRTDVLIQGNVIADCGGSGIGFGGRLDRWIIENNEVVACGVLTEHIVPYGDGREAAFAWTSGIKNWGWGAEGWQGKVVIRNNLVRDGLPVLWAPHPAGRHGHGIWADEVLKPTARPQIHDNRVVNCYSRGIYIEKTDDHDVFNNVVINCAQVRFTAAIEAQSNPFGYDVMKDEADNNAPRKVSGNRIYHNTTLGGWWTFSVNCSSANCSISNTEVRDNLFIGSRPGKAGLYLYGGGANDSVHGDGNHYINNCFGERGQWVWGDTVYRTVNELEAASDGAIRKTLDGRPTFTDPEKGIFRLAPGSIGRNAASDGGDVGARRRTFTKKPQLL